MTVAAPAPVGTREAICLSCREKVCCSYYTVSLTGRDVWRIVKAMHLGPADFLRYYETPEPGPGRFLLSPRGSYGVLVLSKRELPPALPSSCVFLLRTNSGHAVCGLGNLRPGQCRSYPTALRNGEVVLIPTGEGCVRSWSPEEFEFGRERGTLLDLEAEAREYHGIVDRWNHRVCETGLDRSFDDFMAYLLNQYSALEVNP